MNIGVIDFDFLSTKTLCAYSFGVLLVSSYYQIRGSKVRLIIDLSYENLTKYDKIYIFKDYKTKIYPINLIKDYYSLPVEEYGEGFENRPLFPDLPDLIYTPLSIDIYKPILMYIERGGGQFKLDEHWPKANFLPAKIFFEHEGEILLREEPKHKKLWILDDPAIFFIHPLGEQKMTEITKKSIIRFVKPLRIGIVEPKHYRWLIDTNRIIQFKHRLYAYEDDPYLNDFIEFCKNEPTSGYIKIAIKTATGIKWFKKRGGKIYGEYGNSGPKNPNEEGIDNITSKENISIRREWFTTKRHSERNRRSREGASEKERRKYLPSEYERRRREYRSRYNAIRSGKW